MQVSITVKNKLTLNKLVLFGARHNYLSINHGNNVAIEITNVEFDDEYKKFVGLTDYSGKPDWTNYVCFIMDTIKYNFRIISMNGDSLKREIKNTSPVEYETIDELDPYMNSYEYELTSIGEHRITVELKTKN